MTIEPPTLPQLDTPYPLAPEQIAAYQRDGHVLLRGVASPEEVSAYRTVLAEAAARLNTETRPIEQRDTYGKAFLQIMNLWENDVASKQFTFSKRFGRIAAELMGADAVRLYHDQALFKEPGGGHTPWHQDQFYWPLATDQTITMWMALVDAEEQMGTMTFAGGSHEEGFLGHLEISDRSEDVFNRMVADRSFRLSKVGDLKAGDVTFHSGWTLHSAPGNRGVRTREAMTIIYYADGALIGETDNKNRQADLERWLPGCSVGGAASSRLNPVLYP